MNRYEKTKLKPVFRVFSDVLNTSVSSVVKFFRVAGRIDDHELLPRKEKKRRGRQTAH